MPLVTAKGHRFDPGLRVARDLRLSLVFLSVANEVANDRSDFTIIYSTKHKTEGVIGGRNWGA